MSAVPRNIPASWVYEQEQAPCTLTNVGPPASPRSAAPTLDRARRRLRTQTCSSSTSSQWVGNTSSVCSLSFSSSTSSVPSTSTSRSNSVQDGCCIPGTTTYSSGFAPWSQVTPIPESPGIYEPPAYLCNLDRTDYNPPIKSAADLKSQRQSRFDDELTESCGLDLEALAIPLPKMLMRRQSSSSVSSVLSLPRTVSQSSLADAYDADEFESCNSLPVWTPATSTFPRAPSAPGSPLSFGELKSSKWSSWSSQDFPSQLGTPEIEDYSSFQCSPRTTPTAIFQPPTPGPAPLPAHTSFALRHRRATSLLHARSLQQAAYKELRESFQHAFLLDLGPDSQAVIPLGTIPPSPLVEFRDPFIACGRKKASGACWI